MLLKVIKVMDKSYHILLFGSMCKFEDINELYEFLEENAYQFRYLSEIGELFKQIRDFSNEHGKNEIIQKAQWEIDFFEFTARGNDLVAQWIFKNENDEEIGYPDFKNFNDSAYNYLLNRFNSTRHPVLKARYSHLLWQSPKKHKEYAKTAINSYLEICGEYQKKDEENPNAGNGSNVLESISSAFGISMKSQEEVDKVKPRLLELLRDFNEDSRSWYRMKYDLINIGIKNKKHFSEDEKKEIVKMCSETATFFISSNNWNNAISLFEMGQIADQKFALSTCNWTLLIAEAYEKLMIQREKEPMAASSYGEKALGYYKQLKNADKITELERKIESYSKNMEFQAVSTKIDLGPHLEWCEEIARKLSCKSSDEIIFALANDDALLPNYEKLTQLAANTKKETPLLFFAAESVMDERRHTVQHTISEEEKKKSEFYKQYKFYLEMDKIHLIHSIICNAYKVEKLNSNIVCSFLKDYSWLGNTLKRQISKDNFYEYRWIDQLKYGVDDYFICLQHFMDDQETEIIPLLAIDSITLKIEGIIRDICQLKCIPTILTTTDNKGRVLTFEKHIQQLIYDPKLTDILGIETVTFLKFLLVEKLGYNLRHKVAHSLMNIEEYDLAFVHLLLIAILRLGRFKIKAED